jgi:hypothetical protein
MVVPPMSMEVARMRRPAAIAIAAITVLAGCGIDQDPYPLPPAPPGNSVFHAVTLGEAVIEPVVFIEARRDQRVEIVSAEPIGQFEGASVELYASPLEAGADGAAVVSDERIDLEGMFIGDVVDPSADPPENELAIVAEVTATDPGRYVLSGIRLSYRINGAPERDGEGIDVVLTVCADDPAPAVCDDEPTP